MHWDAAPPRLSPMTHSDWNRPCDGAGTVYWELVVFPLAKPVRAGNNMYS